jgi:hypothetical protein
MDRVSRGPVPRFDLKPELYGIRCSLLFLEAFRHHAFKKKGTPPRAPAG